MNPERPYNKTESTARNIWIPADLMPRKQEVRKSTAVIWIESQSRFWNPEKVSEKG